MARSEFNTHLTHLADTLVLGRYNTDKGWSTRSQVIELLPSKHTHSTFLSVIYSSLQKMETKVLADA